MYVSSLPYVLSLTRKQSERPFDGLICYWDTTNGTTDFSTMYTYYPAPTKEQPRQVIEPATFPTLTPYFLDPLTFDAKPGMVAAHAAKMQVKTLLIDPYTSIHLYTGILPIKSLKLPAWSLGAAMRNMSIPPMLFKVAIISNT